MLYTQSPAKNLQCSTSSSGSRCNTAHILIRAIGFFRLDIVSMSLFFKSLLILSVTASVGLIQAAPQPVSIHDKSKFKFDGTKSKHPLSIVMEKVSYKPKQTDIVFVVTNNSDTGVDFSMANWKIESDGRKGFIRESDFDGLRLHPKSKRIAKVVFSFDEYSKSGFLEERKKGTSVITIEDIKTFNNRKLSKVVLSNK